MSAASAVSPRRPRSSARPGVRALATAAVVVVLLVAMGLSTKVVRIGSAVGAAPGAFSARAYALKTFPKVAAAIQKQAVEATTLAAALAADPAAATKRYAVSGSGQPVFSVRFTGTVGQGDAGIYPVAVPGLPPGLQVRVQTGPAINGTDIRDATTSVTFSQFTNQIDFQDAGAALNDRMKQQVLSKVDTVALSGKTVSVVGAFTLVNPQGWLVTPVELSQR